jgi:hypothetical protein
MRFAYLLAGFALTGVRGFFKHVNTLLRQIYVCLEAPLVQRACVFTHGFDQARSVEHSRNRFPKFFRAALRRKRAKGPVPPPEVAKEGVTMVTIVTVQAPDEVERLASAAARPQPCYA